MICAFCGPPGFCVNFSSPVTMKYLRKCMYEKSENNQTWFTIDCPKDHSILDLFAFFFLLMLVFFQENWCGCGSQS